MAELERSGARIFYEVREPAAPPIPASRWVTLLTGHGRSGRDFNTFTRTLNERGFSVLTVDNRGAGRTVAGGDFDLDTIADDVVAVWDALGIERTSVLGISMGGMVAQTLALRPEGKRMTALVLVSTVPAARWISNADQIPGAPTAATPAERFARYFAPAFVEKHRTLFEAFAKEMARNFATPALQEGSARQRKAIAGFDVTGRLGEIAVPTLVLHGREDRIAAPEAAELLHRGIPGAELRWIEGAGHLLLAEQPRALYDVATEFFERGTNR